MARTFRNLAALSLFLCLGGPARATTVRAYIENQKGILKLKTKQAYPAYQNFLKALDADPLSPAVQLNLGLVFDANEEFERAEAADRGALMLLPTESAHAARFQALFNLAGALGHQQKFDQALEAYQEALSLEPQSKEVKNNIELLFQGGGQGQGKDEKDKKDKDGKGQGQGKDQEKPDDKKGKDKGQQNPQDGDQQKKKQPKPFDSQDLSKEDVKKILDEIKNQEQSIRAQEYERNVKEAPVGKDW